MTAIPSSNAGPVTDRFPDEADPLDEPARASTTPGAVAPTPSLADAATPRGASGPTTPVFVGWAVGLVVAWFVLLLTVSAILAATTVAEPGTWFIVWGVTAAVFPASLMFAVRLQKEASQANELDRLADAMSSLVNESGLSESAKRVLHRREERDILRRAIEQDIRAKDWDAALVLVNELADRFGYRGDAENFRTLIERAKSQTTEEQITEAVHALHEVIRQHKWNDAYAEAARIHRLFGDHHRISNIRARIDEARSAYRNQLERKFLEAAERQDIDEAMHLLKELDQYLTPAEAEPFAEVARGVISKSRENLGSRFKLLVQDREWSAAIGVGQQIIDEFPNSRMAAEVRDVLPHLREKADLLTAR
jgi:outer membrane protein assembly factor BamD (BamD/ComL family)